MPSILALLQAARAEFNARNFIDVEIKCREILKINSQQADAMQLLALSLHYRGQSGEGVEWIRKATALYPNHHPFYSILGTLCANAGLTDEAARAHQRAAEMQPQNPDYLSNAGLALLSAGRSDDAIVMFKRALEISADHTNAHNNLGLAYRQAGDLEAALSEFQKSIENKGAPFGVWRNLLMALATQMDVEGLIDTSHKALALFPADGPAIYSYFLLMYLHYSTRISPAEVAHEHRKFGAMITELIKPFPPAPVLIPTDSRKIRIGYVSADFHYHPVAFFFEPILQNHDRSRFEIYCYNCNECNDEVTKQLQSYADHWIDMNGLSDIEAARKIRDDGIDILVDMNGHTSASRLLVFAYDPVPVQISYLGYVGTTGLREMDYFITDPILDRPGDETLYTEKLLYLPRTFACYRPYPCCPPVADRRDAPICFISQHPLTRLNSVVVELWSRILQQLPASRLIISRSDLRDASRRRIASEFESHGISSSRIEFRQAQKSPEHLVYYQDADISLDTTPWSGHTTACESLWMGCPVVTLYGKAHAGRRVSSVLTQIGLTELIAHSPEEYVEIAVQLAKDHERRTFLRQNLRQMMQSSPLMDEADFTRDLEAAYINALTEKNVSK